MTSSPIRRICLAQSPQPDKLTGYQIAEHKCCHTCLQEQDKVRSDLFTAQAAKTRAESKAAQARHLSDARSAVSELLHTYQ